jgi:hypothetical protein
VALKIFFYDRNGWLGGEDRESIWVVDAVPAGSVGASLGQKAGELEVEVVDVVERDGWF